MISSRVLILQEHILSLKTFVLLFQDEYTKEDSLSSRNLTLLLSYLCIFGVCSRCVPCIIMAACNLNVFSKPGIVLGALNHNWLETLWYKTFFWRHWTFSSWISCEGPWVIGEYDKRKKEKKKKKVDLIWYCRNYGQITLIFTQIDLRIWDPCILWGVSQGYSQLFQIGRSKEWDKIIAASHHDDPELDGLLCCFWLSVTWYKFPVLM